LYEKIRINIWDSLHYQYLLNPSKYSEIYEDFLINSGQVEHSIEKFQILLNTFDEKNLSVNPIKYEKFSNHIQVLDGVHRLAIYYFKTHKKTINKTYLDNMKATTISLDGARNKFILNWILKLSRGSIFSNAWAVTKDFPAGYHSFDIFGFYSLGQRNNSTRIDILERHLTLHGRSIVDLGSNTGGMLYHWPSPSHAIGIDFDKRAIFFAKLLKYIIGKQDIEYASRFKFRRQDLDDFDSGYLMNQFKKYRVDTVLLLSIGSWVKNWRELYTYVASFGVEIILETNNDKEGEAQIQHFKNLNMRIKLLSENSNDDITGNSGRKMYQINNLH
jgi:hypothetical protein